MSPLALAPETIIEGYRVSFGSAVVDSAIAFGEACVTVEPSAWVKAARFAREAPKIHCDFLGFVSAIDWSDDGDDPAADADSDDADDTAKPAPPKAPKAQNAKSGDYVSPTGEFFQVFARFYSTQFAHSVTVKTNLDKMQAQIDTLIPVFGGADWHERELMEMFGIEVVGHPNPVKLYLPDEFEGFPLRKSFKLGARLVKPWPGAVDVEDMPDDTPVLDDDGNVVELADAAPAEGDSGDAKAPGGGDK